MTDTRVEDEVAAAALTGAEILYCIQAGGPRRTTVDNINARGANPPTNDGRALGTVGLQWSDLFLASGGVISFAAGDASLTHSAGVLSVAVGSFSFSNIVNVGTTLNVTGDFNINTNKFQVTAANGNTTILGTLSAIGNFAINTNKFNVTASNGNTAIAGIVTVNDVTEVGAGTGSLITLGGLYVTKAAKVNSSTASSSTTTGAFTTPGGMGIGGMLNVGTNMGLSGHFNHTGVSATGSLSGVFLNQTWNSGAGVGNVSNDSAGGAGAIHWQFKSNSSTVGSITTTTTTTTYATSSDERKKFKFDEAGVDWGKCIDDIWVGDFEWKKSPGKPQLGVRAQQAFAHFPQAINAKKWEASYGDFSPLALWGVKDLRQRVAAIEKEMRHGQ